MEAEVSVTGNDGQRQIPTDIKPKFLKQSTNLWHMWLCYGYLSRCFSAGFC